jgi:hypothetical protein
MKKSFNLFHTHPLILLTLIILLIFSANKFSHSYTATVLGPNVVNTSVSNGNWGAGTTWSLGHIPLAAEDVVIAHSVIFNVATGTVASLTIGTGDSLFLNRGTALTVNGTFANNGILTYVAGAGTQSLILKGDFTNAGTFNESPARCRLFFSGTSLQSISNTGTIITPMNDLTVNNPAGISISSAAQLTVLNLNLYTGLVTNSGKLTIGNGGTTSPSIQRGAMGNVSPAGSLDVSPVFNAGTGGLGLIYDDASTPTTTGNEVPATLTFDKLDLFDGAILNLNKSITLNNDLTFNANFSGTLNINANILTLGRTMTLVAGTTGLLNGGPTSNLTMTGAINTNLAGVTNGLNNFTNNNTRTVTLTGPITVFGNLTLGQGSAMKDSVFLTLGNGAVISRSGGTLTAAPTFGTTVDIIYFGTTSFNTNNEMPVANGILNNLTINTTGTITQANTANSVVVNNAFSIISGTYSIGSNTLTLKGPISGTTGLNGGPNSNLTLSGAGSATLPNITNNLKNFRMNRNTNNVITLGGNLSVNILTMQGGKINTGANILSLGTGTDTASIGTMAYTSGQIITGANGGFKRWFAANTVFNVLFPVGATTTLNMITLSFSSAPSAGGSLTAKFVASDPGANSLAAIDDAGYTVDTYSQTGYWQMDLGDGMSNDGIYSLGLEGQGFNVLGTSILNYQLLRILKRPSPGFDWAVDGTHVNGTGTNTDPTAWRSGMTGFSQFTYGGNIVDNPFTGTVPVELLSFTSRTNGRNTILNWSTLIEKNNSGFHIERTCLNDGNNQWTSLGFVSGKNNNTPSHYTYSDGNLQTGKYQYRLKQIDYNGNYKYFNLDGFIEIELPSKYFLSQNYPNPFNPVTKINYELPSDSKVNLTIYDLLGREITRPVNGFKAAGYYTVQINAENLSSGIYFYRLIANANGTDNIYIKKFNVVK